MEEDEFQYQTGTIHEDPIASDNGESVLDANTPIRDARAYFLTIFESRIASASSEWEDLVRAVERGVESYVSLFSCLNGLVDTGRLIVRARTEVI